MHDCFRQPQLVRNFSNTERGLMGVDEELEYCYRPLHCTGWLGFLVVSVQRGLPFFVCDMRRALSKLTRSLPLRQCGPTEPATTLAINGTVRPAVVVVIHIHPIVTASS